MKVALDVPNKLIEIVKKCDFSSIPETQHFQKLEQLKEFATKWIPIKSEADIFNNTYNEINLFRCPPKLINLINKMDFKKVGVNMQNLAIPFIKKYLVDNKLMK